MAHTEEPLRQATPHESAGRERPDGGIDTSTPLAEQVAQSVKDKARAAAEEEKSAGAERIDALGRAVHEAAGDIGREIPGAASYIHSAADALQDASRQVRNTSIDEIIPRFGNFVRTQPGIAFAGCVVVGLALSRFLKSSNQ